MNLLEKLRTASARAKPGTRVIGIDLGTTNSTVAQVQLPLDPAGPADRLCECISIEQMTHSGPYYGSLVPSVVATFRKRVATGLQTGRGFKIPDQKDQAQDTTDFELVTWLVIKKP
jgi:molecular chaperone DnaK (HSP70)